MAHNATIHENHPSTKYAYERAIFLARYKEFIRHLLTTVYTALSCSATDFTPIAAIRAPRLTCTEK